MERRVGESALTTHPRNRSGEHLAHQAVPDEGDRLATQEPQRIRPQRQRPRAGAVGAGCNKSKRAAIAQVVRSRSRGRHLCSVPLHPARAPECTVSSRLVDRRARARVAERGHGAALPAELPLKVRACRFGQQVQARQARVASERAERHPGAPRAAARGCASAVLARFKIVACLRSRNVHSNRIVYTQVHSGYSRLHLSFAVLVGVLFLCGRFAERTLPRDRHPTTHTWRFARSSRLPV